MCATNVHVPPKKVFISYVEPRPHLYCLRGRCNVFIMQQQTQVKPVLVHRGAVKDGFVRSFLHRLGRSGVCSPERGPSTSWRRTPGGRVHSQNGGLVWRGAARGRNILAGWKWLWVRNVLPFLCMHESAANYLARTLRKEGSDSHACTVLRLPVCCFESRYSEHVYTFFAVPTCA